MLSFSGLYKYFYLPQERGGLSGEKAQALLTAVQRHEVAYQVPQRGGAGFWSWLFPSFKYAQASQVPVKALPITTANGRPYYEGFVAGEDYERCQQRIERSDSPTNPRDLYEQSLESAEHFAYIYPSGTETRIRYVQKDDPSLPLPPKD